MESLLHSTPFHTTVPSCFIFPPDQLKPATSTAVSLPLVDLSGRRDEVCRAMHPRLRQGSRLLPGNVGHEVSKEFFQLPVAAKADFYSEDVNKANRLFSGTVYDTDGERYWRDCLHLSCSFPVGDSAKGWPDRPYRLREVVEKYTVQTRGRGPGHDYFAGDTAGGDVVLNVNHYPPCPDPSLTLGLPPHCDRCLITVLLPGTVPGLEVAYRGDWVKVEAVPNAFVVNFGCQLEIVTNGILKSIEHRVMTNLRVPRTTVATFIMPTRDCVIGPAEEFIGEDNPPCYRTLTFGEFQRIFRVVRLGSSLNCTTNLKNAQKER
uniref:Fe2OG dioxygenase domain-containing protein n=1 Tax=Setaria viridis TaxID=4556 RepID=A0A4U6VMY0_SETVI|nr:hypothetical protein SEVIR_3G369900v2 [Setaria viridis]